MAHLKGHRVRVEEVDGKKVAAFDPPDLQEMKDDVTNLRERRAALLDKVSKLDAAITELAREEAELLDVLRELGEDL